MADALGSVLRLVAEGRLTAEEAAPLLDALDRTPEGGPAAAGGRATGGTSGMPRPATSTAERPADGAPTTVRIEVRDAGRQVVNLRLPLALGRFAVERVPGLAGEHADRIREALRLGFRGPVVEVDEGDGDGVRIVLE
jgi:SHOCT-like protein